MKKLLILSLALLVGAPLCGLVWSEDPKLTPEEREKAREFNKRMKKSGLMGSRAERKKERELLKKNPEQYKQEQEMKTFGKEGEDPRTWGPKYHRGNPEVMNVVEGGMGASSEKGGDPITWGPGNPETWVGGPGTGTPKESSDEIQEKLYGLGLVRDLPEIKKQYNRGNPDVMNEHQEEAEEDTDDSHFDDED